MNFLQLCQRVRQEAGIAGETPYTVVNQNGELGRIVSWVNQAYEDIQDKRDDWWFLRNTFTFNCVVGTSEYAKTIVANLANWKKNSLRIYLSTTIDEVWLNYIEWDDFRDTRLMGANRTVTGRPIDFTIKPDRSIVFWPIPDQIYTITGEFYRVSASMSANADVPLFDHFHMAIVYNALMRYAAYSSDPAVYASSQKEYGRLMAKLESDYSSIITLGSPLA